MDQAFSILTVATDLASATFEGLASTLHALGDMLRQDDDLDWAENWARNYRRYLEAET